MTVTAALPPLSHGERADIPPAFIAFPPVQEDGTLDPLFKRYAPMMPRRFGCPHLRYRPPTVKRDWLFV